MTVPGCRCPKPHAILRPTAESEKLREREWGNPPGTYVCLTIVNPVWARVWAIQGLSCQACSAACPGSTKPGQSQGSGTQSYLTVHCGHPLGLVHGASICLSELGGSSYSTEARQTLWPPKSGISGQSTSQWASVSCFANGRYDPCPLPVTRADSGYLQVKKDLNH